MLKVNGARLLNHLDELAKIGRTESSGVTRLSLSKEDLDARRYILELMKHAGLSAHADKVANVIGVLEGISDGGAVASGSHTDTVANGGNLDGCYGVIAAIECAHTMMEKGLTFKHPILVVDFTNEEGVRFPALTGSKYLTGQIGLSDAYAQQDSDGMTMEEALRNSPLRLTEPRAAPYTFDSYVELHIEQGATLDKSKEEIGIVQGIVGVRRYNVTIKGAADHAGTTPLNLRKDSLLAAAKVVVAINKLASEVGRGAVGTVGQLVVSPNKSNVVASEVELTIDFRHARESVLDGCDLLIRKTLKRIALSNNVEVAVSSTVFVPPSKMAPRIVKTIKGTASESGLNYRLMQSGAGHDAMIMSNVTETGMIFVPSRGGNSHSPLEFTEPRALVDGANLLLNVLAKLAS